ncbi:MAG: SdpI family protein [Verrucomicrobiae bacterium]|nr:SdpI family protein [Verrucomicrobiae bacterium]
MKLKGPTPEKILPAIFYGVAIIQILAGIPLALSVVPQNSIYGFRTRSTLANETIWYEMNQIFGIALVLGQIIILIATLLILSKKRNLKEISIYKVGIGLNIIVLIVAALLTFILANNI